jgi:predicted O-methyltransferase YrrM
MQFAADTLAKLRSRPRLFNLLHALGFVAPSSQTREDELQCLERWAKGRSVAVEIGTFMGVSAARLAAMLGAGGTLYCVDPYGDGDPIKAIFLRHIRRQGLTGKVAHIGAKIVEAGPHLPSQWDFVFVDGDHSYEGIQTDWSVVRCRIAGGGIAAFHDTIVPEKSPERDCGAVRFFAEVIANDPDFEIVEQVHTLSVIRRLR